MYCIREDSRCQGPKLDTDAERDALDGYSRAHSDCLRKIFTAWSISRGEDFILCLLRIFSWNAKAFSMGFCQAELTTPTVCGKPPKEMHRLLLGIKMY